jgi:pimeloyl-ACP methyl ester carboxylesterase
MIILKGMGMPQVKANGISIEYESFGSAEHETILLIMGLGCQLTLWPMELCQSLVEQGYRVVRFDNRDVGLSSKFDHVGTPDMTTIAMGLMSGKPLKAPYSLEEMANDTVGLMQALGINSAHIVGASMGGMIAQLMAVHSPQVCRSLTSIMSSTGNPGLPPSRPEAIMAMMAPSPAANQQDAMIERGVRIFRAIGSPAYPTDETTLREWVRRDGQRSYSPNGALRQLLAIATNGDRRQRLAKLRLPTMVIHGSDDPLIPVEAGRDTAKSIAGAQLRVIPGMGHDLPLALIDQFTDAITTVAKLA